MSEINFAIALTVALTGLSVTAILAKLLNKMILNGFLAIYNFFGEQICYMNQQQNQA